MTNAISCTWSCSPVHNVGNSVHVNNPASSLTMHTVWLSRVRPCLVSIQCNCSLLSSQFYAPLVQVQTLGQDTCKLIDVRWNLTPLHETFKTALSSPRRVSSAYVRCVSLRIYLGVSYLTTSVHNVWRKFVGNEKYTAGICYLTKFMHHTFSFNVLNYSDNW